MTAFRRHPMSGFIGRTCLVLGAFASTQGCREPSTENMTTFSIKECNIVGAADGFASKAIKISHALGVERVERGQLRYGGIGNVLTVIKGHLAVNIILPHNT